MAQAKSELLQQAATWVARLSSEDATPGDHQAFRQWSEADPAHAAAYAELSSLWSDLREARLPADQLGHLQRRGIRRNALATVAAAAALALTGLYSSGQIDRWRADYATVTGEIRAIMLADGSKVILNTDTAILVDQSDRKRRVRLLRGEAWFDVVPDATRPFVVEGEATTTRVLGTGFSVGLAGDGQPERVVVEHGRVAVRLGQERIELTAGERAEARAHDLQLDEILPEAALAWRKGRYEFSRRPLAEVMAEIGRYRSGRIFVRDSAADLLVSGIIDLSDTDAALRELSGTAPIRLRSFTDALTIVEGL